MRFGGLVPVTAWDDHGRPADLKGPRHRAVLARLIVAQGRVVPLGVLIDDLWPVPPANAAGAIRTFVGALRRALEPDRPPRSPSRLLVTRVRGTRWWPRPATWTRSGANRGPNRPAGPGRPGPWNWPPTA